jgi:hypothetical protein
MKTWMLVSGILLLGMLLGYLLFLLLGNSSGGQDVYDGNTLNNRSVQNTILPSSPSNNGGSSFQTQSFTDRPNVIER